MPKATKAPRSFETRERLLDAAEGLFAKHGFDGTSVQQIAHAAALSNAAPIFFFGSKRGLYDAVLERSFSKIREMIEGYATPSLGHETLEERLTTAVESYVSLVASRTNFARLVEWENLSAGARLGQSLPHVAAMQAALGTFQTEIEHGFMRDVDPEQLVISMLALCWFPITHRIPLLRGLGRDPDDPTFLQRRIAHVVDLILYGILPRETPPRSRAAKTRRTKESSSRRSGV